MRSPKLCLAACLAAAIATPAGAAAPTGTLKKIADSGTIVIGHRDSAIPFAYLADGSKPAGYSIDLAGKVVEAVRKELGRPNIAVRYALVTGQTRIPLLVNGTIDLECGATTNNAERAQQVDFSVGIFSIGTRLMTHKASGIRDFADLKGKNVVVAAGTTSERILRKMNADANMGLNIVSAKDNGEAFLMLETQRVAAFMSDDAMLYGERAKARVPTDWIVTGTPQSREVYGCMVRKGDTAFKAVVDKALKAVYASGEIERIYQKWFMQPIPPKGLNMNFPMSPEWRALIRKPNDQPAGR
ncbi:MULTISPECIES: transporter substrate-binding domain-containing protein [Gulbenkiania]|uniref:ABC-type amino acid transport/signal transduction system, periplasmic component/domain n=2 Tax=Gulbenkiania TaxID=397456 RepID=A0A0K6GX52_9NEIS|nr:MULTISPECIES: transporter substrate-binding domain-containing protein [Gulbenkiania]TCW33100.1 glutamate/aspartate transport system substrate-binding protein [Gulbenkiania mobilis]CUA83068.1 ABC-type amino acid transport/signal transduction system, periplasmic component/domain [Gulbenkiania indica]